MIRPSRRLFATDQAQFIRRAAAMPNQIRTIMFNSSTAVARRMNRSFQLS